jgi:hypothetical protein
MWKVASNSPFELRIEKVGMLHLSYAAGSAARLQSMSLG